MDQYYARTLKGERPEKWQTLTKHLVCIANLAAEFAAHFDSAEWGHLAGLWHDLGKYQAEFQERLLGSRLSVEHSGAGAALAVKKGKELGYPLAFAIAGHHAGMTNPTESDVGMPTPLRERLQENGPTIDRLADVIPVWFTFLSLLLPQSRLVLACSGFDEWLICRQLSIGR
jgi:CRISPR-associated endonuclease/helicase Cas3